MNFFWFFLQSLLDIAHNLSKGINVTLENAGEILKAGEQALTVADLAYKVVVFLNLLKIFS